jgi:hypothetical protein
LTFDNPLGVYVYLTDEDAAEVPNTTLSLSVEVNGRFDGASDPSKIGSIGPFPIVNPFEQSSQNLKGVIYDIATEKQVYVVDLKTSSTKGFQKLEQMDLKVIQNPDINPRFDVELLKSVRIAIPKSDGMSLIPSMVLVWCIVASVM